MRLVVCAVSVLVLACSQDLTLAEQNSRFIQAVDQEFHLAIGETAVVTGTDVRVTARAVVNDSRCPREVQCISAGSAEIALQIHQGSRDTIFALQTMAEPETAIIPGFSVELTSLTPYPDRPETPIPPDAYRVGLFISALPPLTGTPLRLTRIAATSYGGFDTATIRVVRDASSWSDFWYHIHRFHGEVPPLPAIDFATEMVVAVASGENPTAGYDVLLTAAALDRGVVVVQALERSPGTDCVTAQVLTHPIDLARLPKREGPVVVAVTQRVRHCGG